MATAFSTGLLLGCWAVGWDWGTVEESSTSESKTKETRDQARIEPSMGSVGSMAGMCLGRHGSMGAWGGHGRTWKDMGEHGSAWDSIGDHRWVRRL